MPTQILAAGKTVAESSDGDLTIATGATATVGLFLADDDNLLLPDGSPYWEGDFLLPDDVSILLLPTQATGGIIPWGDKVAIYRKDPLGAFNHAGVVLDQRRPNTILGPGVWQVKRYAVTSASIGVQKD